MSDDMVWIPAVPLPFLGSFTDRCWSCGKRFRGRNRRWNYEIHYRREHQREEDTSMLQQVPRAEAKRIYDAVNA